MFYGWYKDHFWVEKLEAAAFSKQCVILRTFCMMMAIPYTELHNSKIRCQQASLLRVEDFSKFQQITKLHAVLRKQFAFYQTF